PVDATRAGWNGSPSTILKLQVCDLVLSALRCGLREQADGEEHVALPDLQCDTDRHLPDTVLEGRRRLGAIGSTQIQNPAKRVDKRASLLGGQRIQVLLTPQDGRQRARMWYGQKRPVRPALLEADQEFPVLV